MIQEIGTHRVKNGNVMAGIDDLMRGEKADLVYSDPPWGSGNLKYWETMRRKMDKVNPDEPRVDFDLTEFLAQIFGIAQKFAKNYVIIEYGQKWAAELIHMAETFGFKHNGKVVTRYSSENLPLDLHVFSRTGGGLPPGFEATVAGTKGYDTVRKAFEFFKVPGGIVLDPCCGMGYTAQAAIDNGMSFRGNEMNATRLQKTINRLKK